MANPLRTGHTQSGFVRAHHSLTDAEVLRISLALIDLAPDWLIERHESCDGNLSVIMLHATDDNALVVDRHAHGFAISSLQGDDWKPCIHKFDGLADLLAALALIIDARSFFQDKRAATAKVAMHDREAVLL